MSLTDRQRSFVRDNYKKLSLRQIAKELGCSRPEVEKYVSTLSSSIAADGSRFVPKIPASFLAVALFVLTFLTYSNTLHYGLVWDDLIQITKNPLLKDKTLAGLVRIFKFPVGIIPGSHEYASSSYRPLQTLSYWLNQRFWGPDPAVYHATNLGLQGLAAVLLFFLIRKLLNSKETAFWVSALFAVHPLQIAAVTYVSGRAESLAAIFMFSSFLFFCKAQPHSAARRFFWMALSAAFFLAALLTKEVTMVLPALFATYACIYKTYREGERWRWKPLVSDNLAYVAALAVYLTVRLRVLGTMGQGGIGSMSMSDRACSALMSIFEYVRLIFLPYGLHMAYQLPAPSIGAHLILAGALVCALLVTATWIARRWPPVFLGLLWFWIFLIPVLNLLVLVNGPMAEHWLYNPIVGFFIAAVTAFFVFSDRSAFFKRVSEAVLALAVLCLAATTYHSNPVWKDEISLYKNILKYTHYFAEIYNNLGVVYADKHRLNEAEECFQKALEVDPNFEKAKVNLETLKRQQVDSRHG